MVVKKKIQTLTKNYEPCFKKLAEIQGIQLKKGWKLQIANFFNIQQSLLSNWFKRGAPGPALDYAATKGYPPDLWYISPQPYPEVQEEIGAPDHGHARNPNGHMSWSVEPDRFARTYRASIISKMEIAPEHTMVIKKVVAILDSGEIETIEALKANVDQFAQKINDKHKYKQLIVEHKDVQATLSKVQKRQDALEMLLNRSKKEPPGLREPVDPAGNG